MPVASVSQETVRKDLKSLPDAFVELKRMSYGEWLHRQELMLKMKIEGGTNGKDQTAEVAMVNKAVTQYEFQKCIVNHNLEIAEGQPFDFRTIAALELLDPKVGNEIGRYISELHEFDEGNSQTGSGE